METLYDSKGNAVAYLLDDDESIYTFKGQPVAWLSGDHVYSYNGKYLGWYQSGSLYDRSSRPALFTSGASGGLPSPQGGLILGEMLARQGQHVPLDRQAPRVLHEAPLGQPSPVWNSSTLK